MKSLLLLLVFVSAFELPLSAQTSSNEEKQKKKEENFEHLKKLIETKKYTFRSLKAYPQKGPMIDMINRNNILKVNEDRGYGDLSYFGRAYSGGYTDDVGIKFDGTFESYKVDVNEKKNRLTVQFQIKGSNDNYNCILSASSVENASLSVTSNNKQSIRYSGGISELKE